MSPIYSYVHPLNKEVAKIYRIEDDIMEFAELLNNTSAPFRETVYQKYMKDISRHIANKNRDNLP